MSRWTEIYNLACARLADPLPARPGADHQDQRARRDQHAGAGQAHRRQDLPGLHQRGLRRPRRCTPQTEDYWGHVNPIGFRSCYDEGKRCAETLFFDYHRQHGVRIKVARIFNTYGPRMHPADGRVVSNFIMQALTGEPITIYGEGRADAFVLLLPGPDRCVRADHGHPPPPPATTVTGPVNIGNPDEFTIRQLAEKVIEMTGSSSTLAFRDLPSDDPTQRRPDISHGEGEARLDAEREAGTGPGEDDRLLRLIGRRARRTRPAGGRMCLHTPRYVPRELA